MNLHLGLLSICEGCELGIWSPWADRGEVDEALDRYSYSGANFHMSPACVAQIPPVCVVSAYVYVRVRNQASETPRSLF